MHPIISFCETQIFPVIEPVIATAERHKLHLLDKDLAVLNHSPATLLYEPLTPPIDLATALGHMYVIEGSTLGGRMIAKHINKHLGLDENNGAAFFTGYGNATGPLWQAFMTTFTEYVADTQSEAVVIGAARDTFAAIDEYFKKA
jgi:heme oxygenase